MEKRQAIGQCFSIHIWSITRETQAVSEMVCQVGTKINKSVTSSYYDSSLFFFWTPISSQGENLQSPEWRFNSAVISVLKPTTAIIITMAPVKVYRKDFQWLCRPFDIPWTYFCICISVDWILTFLVPVLLWIIFPLTWQNTTYKHNLLFQEDLPAHIHFWRSSMLLSDNITCLSFSIWWTWN